jgi:hypothetical protein
MKQTCSSEDAVHSHISFVTRDDKFSQEKPYILRFSPADGFPSQNVATHTAELSLVDIRSQPPMRYDECGIKVLELDTSMQRQDFESKDTIRDVYLPLLQDAVKTSLGAKNVKVIPHIVELPEPHYATYKIRRQPTGFPRSTGESLEDEVPATVAHIGEAILLQSAYGLLIFASDATRVELQRAIASCDVGHVPEECRVEWVKYVTLFVLRSIVADLTVQYMGSSARSGPSVASGRLR